MEATVGIKTQWSKLGQRRPQRALRHSGMNWGNEDHRGHSVRVEWTGAMGTREGTQTQWSELGQWRPEMVLLIHSWVNWGNESQTGHYWFRPEWTGTIEGTLSQLEGTGAVKAREGTLHSQLSEMGQWRPESIWAKTIYVDYVQYINSSTTKHLTYTSCKLDHLVNHCTSDTSKLQLIKSKIKLAVFQEHLW